MQKSLGHSHILGPQYRTPEGAWAVAHKLLHKAAMRLRMERLTASSMHVTIRYALTREQVAQAENAGKRAKRHFSGLRHSGWSMEARFPPCQDTLTLLEALRGMWDRRPEGAQFARPFFVGVTMHNLIAESDLQPSLFADPNHRARPCRRHGPAQHEVRQHNAALRRNAARQAVRANPHLLHPDPGEVRLGLHLDRLPQGRKNRLLRRRSCRLGRFVAEAEEVLDHGLRGLAAHVAACVAGTVPSRKARS